MSAVNEILLEADRYVDSVKDKLANDKVVTVASGCGPDGPIALANAHANLERGCELGLLSLPLGNALV